MIYPKWGMCAPGADSVDRLVVETDIKLALVPRPSTQAAESKRSRMNFAANSID